MDLRSIILCCVVIIVKGEVSFTKISYTTAGQPCLTDCKKHMCITGWNLAQEPCIPGNEPAPTYYTAQTQEKTTCLSRCGKFGYSYNWCIVSNDLTWDYCSPEVKVSWKRNQKHSLNYGPCIDECKKDGSYSKCNTHWGYTDECDAKTEHNYVAAKTVYGLNCLGECKQHKGKSKYYWCYDETLKVSNCAPPASPPSLNIYAEALAVQEKHCESKARGKRCTDVSCGTKCKTDSAVLRMAAALEKSNSFQTKHIEEYRNPIFSYTVKPSANANEPSLPLVIRANITTDSIRPSNNDMKTLVVSEELKNNIDLMSGDKDDSAFLIGFKNGGPAEIYNVVPQSRNTYKSWRSYSKTIYDWVQQDIGNKVEVTVVVLYENNSTRPSAFGLSLLFKNNGDMCKEPKDQIVNNGKTTFRNKNHRKPSPPVKKEDTELDLEYLLGLF